MTHVVANTLRMALLKNVQFWYALGQRVLASIFFKRCGPISWVLRVCTKVCGWMCSIIFLVGDRTSVGGGEGIFDARWRGEFLWGSWRPQKRGSQTRHRCVPEGWERSGYPHFMPWGEKCWKTVHGFGGLWRSGFGVLQRDWWLSEQGRDQYIFPQLMRSWPWESPGRLLWWWRWHQRSELFVEAGQKTHEAPEMLLRERRKWDGQEWPVTRYPMRPEGESVYENHTGMLCLLGWKYSKGPLFGGAQHYRSGSLWRLFPRQLEVQWGIRISSFPSKRRARSKCCHIQCHEGRC